MLRIIRDLVPIEGMDVLTPEDMSEMYDYLVNGNLDKDELNTIKSRKYNRTRNIHRKNRKRI